MISPSGLIVNIRAQLVETDAAFYSDTELYSYLSQAEMILANTIECTKTTSTLYTVVGQREYARPSGALVIDDAVWNGFTLIKVNDSDIPIIEGSQYGFTGSMGNPIYYYENGESIGLSPIPNASSSFVLSYSKSPDPIPTVSGTFSIPGQFVYYLVDYVMYRCYAKDNDQNRSLFHINLWNVNIQKAASDYARRQRNNQIVVVRDREYIGPFIY